MTDLAIKIRAFVDDYDTYEYGDTFGTKTDHTEAINHFENMLQSKEGINSLIAYFNDDVIEHELLEDEKDFSIINKASEIKRELEGVLEQI